MLRQASREANAKSRKKSKNFHNDTIDKAAELTLDDLDHLVSEDPYDCTHIAWVARSLLKECGYKCEQKLSVVISVNQLEERIKRLKLAKLETNPLFVAYRLNDVHWVTFCITHSNNAVVLLYKDSLGGDVPKEIGEAIRKCFVGATFKVNLKKEQQDGHSSGPLALKNMKTLMKMLKENKQRLISDFENIQFCLENDVQEVKREFRDAVSKDVAATCVRLAKEIAESRDFKQEIVKLVESSVDCINLSSDVEKYDTFLRDEAKKKEEDPDYKIDTAALKKMKYDIMKHPQMKLLSDQAESSNGSGRKRAQSNNNAIKGRVVLITEIEKKYPEQMKKFTKVFKLLGVAAKNHVTERDGVLLQVCDILGVNQDRIAKMYQSLIPDESDGEEERKAIQSKFEEGVIPVDIDEVCSQLTELVSKSPFYTDLAVKSTEQIISEIQLEEAEDGEKSNPSDEKALVISKGNNKESPRISDLEKQLITVKKIYEQWKFKGARDIKVWAMMKRNALNIVDLCEAVAVMDRANELVTGGHRLRDTQILAILDILGTANGQGKLSQIETGEGKTAIVSLLAAFKVLKGNRVDVITSNEILAEEGVKNRKYFFGALGISVAHNNPEESYKQGPRKCYTADVVYGSMGSFQFDYLRDSFEGFETRGKRQFDFVILDEVDSLLLDDGGNIAKLAEPFPGFDSLKYVYIKIWQELFKAENELVSECEKALKCKAEELSRNHGSLSAENMEAEYESYRTEILANQENKLTDKIKKCDPANIDLIPTHLKQFARDMVDEWIKNAIYAKYSCNENEQYVVRRLKDDEEPKIVPVDYQSTGMRLKNTMWTGGLHQFVQLKHNLNITSETLTSSLISNIGYVKLYKHNIFGLTGTLGSKAEQELLSKAYNVRYSKIPNFKPKIFKEICGKVIKNDLFKFGILQDTLEVMKEKRSVLIICNTISDVFGLEKKIKKMKSDRPPKISIYIDEDSSGILDKEIGVGEIIISTNIAGRGADFKTSQELETNGGLHVLVCFLPVNQRVEDQAFGRTSRQGNKGTAQIVMRESELLGLGFEQGQDFTFEAIKERRDQLESCRLAKIRDVELAEIDYHDSIFRLFSDIYRQILKVESEQPSMLYLLKDLKEFWAFWLHRKQRNKDTLLNVDEEFKCFTHEASGILGDVKSGEYVGGEILHNPYYSIQQAEHFLQNNLIERAEKSLKHAIELSGPFAELLYPAHLKMFEVSVEQGQAIMQIFANLVQKYFSFDKEAKNCYKMYAKAALVNAKKGMENEINYIERNLTGGINSGQQTQSPDNQDFLNILRPDPENVLVKHVKSKLTILIAFSEHVERLLAQIEPTLKNKTGIAFRSKIPNYWSTSPVSSEQAELRKNIGDDELKELALNGLGTVYSIRILSSETTLNIGLIKPGLIQVGMGAAALAFGWAFPPMMPIMQKIAEMLIVEGTVDIVEAIITGGEARLDLEKKLCSYVAQASTFGLQPGRTYQELIPVLIRRIIKACINMVSRIIDDPELTDLWKWLLSVIKKVFSLLETAMDCGQPWHKMKFKTIGINAMKTGASAFIQYLLDEKRIDDIMEHLQPKVEEYVGKTVNCGIKRKDCQSVRKEMVLELLADVLKESSNEVLNDIVRMIVESLKSWEKLSGILEDFGLESAASYTEEVCKTLSKRLMELPKEEQEFCSSDEEVDEIIKEVAVMVAGHVNGQMKKQLKKLAALLIRLGKLGIQFYSCFPQQ